MLHQVCRMEAQDQGDHKCSYPDEKIPFDAMHGICLSITSLPHPFFLLDLVLKHISVPRLAIDHVNDSLVSLLHATLLDPRLDLLVRSELQHLSNLSR